MNGGKNPIQTNNNKLNQTDSKPNKQNPRKTTNQKKKTKKKPQNQSSAGYE